MNRVVRVMILLFVVVSDKRGGGVIGERVKSCLRGHGYAQLQHGEMKCLV